MRRIAAIVLTLAILAPSIAGAAATPRDKFGKAVAKQAISAADELAGKWKALCVCRATNRVGAVVTYTYMGQLYATCSVVGFDDATGEIDQTIDCPDYIPLVK